LEQEQPAGQDEPPAVDEVAYEALYAALASTARGRAFLDEVARRARNADTLAALAALARIESKLNDTLDDKAADKTGPTQDAAVPSPAPAAIAPAAISEVDEEPFAGIPSDEAYVPFELEEPEAPNGPEPISAAPAAPARRASSADVLAQVMAMSPEERIALFS
jgi:hypothetical protein